MRSWPGSALRVAECLLARGAARRMAKRRAVAGANGASASEEDGADATEEDGAPPSARVPILDVLGADELRLVVEALGECTVADWSVAVHRLRCCSRALRDAITNDDVTRHVAKLSLGHPYRARRAGFGTAFPRPGAEARFADMPRQVFVGRRPRPTGVTRWSRREAPYELEVMPPEGSDELRYVNPILVFDHVAHTFTEVVLLMDRRGLLSEIFRGSTTTSSASPLATDATVTPGSA